MITNKKAAEGTTSTAENENQKHPDDTPPDQKKQFKYEGLNLLPQHTKLLLKSAISEKVAYARGYRSIKNKIEAEEMGFGKIQCRPPALLIPIWDAKGENVSYQLRPDNPRFDRQRNRMVKYENPSDSFSVLDVPPTVRWKLASPYSPIFITEGVFKEDALASLGCCVMSPSSVWTWRGKNLMGGTTAISDWEYIHLKNRKIYIVFDSDVMINPSVYSALSRLKKFLEGRGAIILLIYLPAGEGGEKVGVDDFIASGKTLDDLLAFATTELKKSPRDDGKRGIPYEAKPGGLVWYKSTQNGVEEVPLTKFNARIVSEIIEDDGVETNRQFEIEAGVGDRVKKFRIPSNTFDSMNWATKELGTEGAVFPGGSIKDHTRFAILELSGMVPKKEVRTHTGWVEKDNDFYYLHSSGSIGTNGSISIHTSLGDGLGGVSFPDPPKGEELQRCVRASLKLLDLAPPHIVYSIFSAIYRAPLGGADFSVALIGATGEGKTELCALGQQHYGSGLGPRNLMANWSSTANYLEGLCFLAKDTFLLIDDFAPSGTQYDIHKLNATVERIIRGQGNHSGRGRMRADGSIKPTKPSRALVVLTGEAPPRGTSLVPRMIVLELSPGDLNWEKITICQDDANQGVFAGVMAGYIQWLAPRYGDIKKGLNKEISDLRKGFTELGSHNRTPGNIASLGIGLRYFLKYAIESGAITKEEGEKLWKEGKQALIKAGGDQAQHQIVNEPARRFIELLKASFIAGKVHVTTPDGEAPEDAESWGWRSAEVGTGEHQRVEWRPQGDKVGWCDDEELYILAEVAYSAVQRMGRDSGEMIPINIHTMKKRLHEKGYLRIEEVKGRKWYEIRKTFNDQRIKVLCLRKNGMLYLENGANGAKGANEDISIGKEKEKTIEGLAPSLAPLEKLAPSETKPAEGDIKMEAPIIGQKVQTPLGRGEVWQVFESRIGVVLDDSTGKVEFFNPEEIVNICRGTSTQPINVGRAT